MKTTETNFWQAIQTRDANFDGVFFYGVKSTGIFCRPSCHSKTPKPENIIFFALPAAAEHAGFRACLRCTPNKITAQNPQAELVERACQILAQANEEQIDLANLGARLQSSPFHLQRVFKKFMGITPRQFAESLRLTNFKAQLKNGSAVTAALYEAGFGSSSRLYEKAASQLGMTPAVYRQGAKGMKITYTTADCPLGKILVAATECGICSVTLGDDDEILAKSLRAEFPQADVQRDEKNLQTWVAMLLQHLAGQLPHLDLPLDVQATAFQKRVWDELRRIPYGQTASYAEIAVRLGQPTAARAVARACATNPVALLTPCHRVVRGNGELSGYRWGIARKKALLAQEHNAHI